MLFFFCPTLQMAGAQTNVAFQNCEAGDLVKVDCDNPLVLLGKAKLLEIGSNTVTVCTANDRFTFDKTNVSLVLLESHATRPPEVSPMIPAARKDSPRPTKPPTVAPLPVVAQTMESIRASVID